MGAAVDICSFIANAHKFVDICAMIDEVQGVQHFPRDVDPAHTAELEASLSHQGVKHSCGLIIVSTVHPVVETWVLYDSWNCKGERRLVVRDDCYARVFDRRPSLRFLNISNSPPIWT